MSVDPAVPAALDAIPVGHGEGIYAGRRWGVTHTASPDGRRRWLFGEERGGGGRVSFNLYRLAAGPVLKPCEMPAAEVIAFVLGYVPDGNCERNRTARPPVLSA